MNAVAAGSDLSAPTKAATLPSLPEAYRTVRVGGVAGLRRFLAFAGPGYMVSVGYMDPGNWATDLAGGAKFGYALLWVILLSNLMAQFLQVLCARLGLVAGKDLAQACRAYYSKPAAIALWLLCEVAIIACDLAEVIGAAVALQLLFGIPLLTGVLITGLDVLLLLMLTGSGFRMLEAIVITLVATVAGCFALEMFMAKPSLGGIVSGLFIPTLPNLEALTISVGILGATVMPHNLYLHSSIVQTRDFERTPEGLRQAVRYNSLDTVIALSAAFFVNASILILAAAVFHPVGQVVEELQEAHRLLAPMLGGAASTAFAVALLASGQSSTITGTLAGQIVMEGFVGLRLRPWVRRILTRSLALVPAILLITWTGGKDTVGILVLSQVVLSMQLPFAIFPLVAFTSDRKIMGDNWANPAWMKWTGYAMASAISGLNIYLLYKGIGPLWLGAFAMLGASFAAWVRFGYRRG